MTCKDVMTPNPRVCTTVASAQAAAELMREENVGVIPVVDETSKKLVGVITDRDLCLAVVATSKSPQKVVVSDIMSKELVTCKPEEDIRNCEERMKAHQIRRIPVVDDNGRCIGIISQGDLAVRLSQPEEVHETVREISKPGRSQAA